MRATAVLLLLGAVLAGCTARPADVPSDVPDPGAVARHDAPGFRLWIDRGCLSPVEVEELAAELVRARAFLEDWLGPAMMPGSFRPDGVVRASCPERWDFGPRPPVGTIDVVVLAEGGRCHADREGITVVRRHVARHDATHELVHFLAGTAWPPIDEGLAVYLTERIWGPDKGFPLAVRAKAYRDLSLETYLTPRELEGGMSRRDYDVAGAFCGWLIESFGREAFLRLYAGAARDYYTTYETGERDLMERFWAHVRSQDLRHDSAYLKFKGLVEAR